MAGKNQKTRLEPGKFRVKSECCSRDRDHEAELDLMKIKGYAIGEDSWGVRLKEEIKMTANEMPTVEEIVAKFPKISEFKVISLEGSEKNKKVADLDWIGDLDSCEADEMMEWEARNFNSFST